MFKYKLFDRLVCLSAIVTMMTLFSACEKNKEEGTQPVTKVPEIKVTPAEPNALTAAGGQVELSLKSNMDWKVTGVPAWMTVSPESGTASNYKQTVTVTAQKNTGGAREALIVFTIDGASDDVLIKQRHNFGSDAPSDAIFFESFKSSMGDFTIEDVKVPAEMSCVWEHSTQYACMKGTAFSNPNNYESESWLISPDIDLSEVSQSYLTFEHAGGYFGTASEEATVWVSAEGGEWQQLVIESSAYPTSWTFLTAGNWDLSSYAGKKIRLGFKYCSTAAKAGTWEVRNVAILSGAHEEVAIPDVDPTKVDWLELPATDNDAYGYYSHRFMMNDAVYRNYSFAWSQEDHVSVWVAYPLAKDYLTNVVSRQDTWNYDPILGKELSSAPFSNYAGDYARGHQLPSGDRLCCKAANDQTFYGTNIVPQINEHNEGIWADLEGWVRDIASSSDTTYVVTGCVLDHPIEMTEDSEGKVLAVPEAFFKALLRYEKTADGEKWAAAAFYTEHRNYVRDERDIKSVSMSVDELEEMIGIDFFVHLSDKIGKDKADAVEAQNPSEVAEWLF